MKPTELRRGYHIGGRIAFYALFEVEPTEVPPAGWQRESVTHYLSDGTPATAYCKYFPWNARLIDGRIVLI